MVWAVRVSLHALSRYRERIETDAAGGDDDVRYKILIAYRNSRPVQLRSTKERVSKLLRHGVETTYRQYQDQVLVVTGGNVVSVYLYEKSRWEPVK